MALYTLAANFNYGDIEAEMIRDRLVVGIWDTSLSERLQLDADLTLEKAKKAIRQRRKLCMNSKIYSVELIPQASSSPLQWQPQEEPAVPRESQLRRRGERATETDRQAVLTLRKREALTRKVPGKGRNLPQVPKEGTLQHTVFRENHIRRNLPTTTSGLDTAFLDAATSSSQEAAWFTRHQSGRTDGSSLSWTQERK